MVVVVILWKDVDSTRGQHTFVATSQTHFVLHLSLTLSFVVRIFLFFSAFDMINM